LVSVPGSGALRSLGGMLGTASGFMVFSSFGPQPVAIREVANKAPINIFLNTDESFIELFESKIGRLI